jgi:hypothetical protein
MPRPVLRLAALLLLVLAVPARAAAWTVQVDERQGLPVVALGGAAAVTSTFVFWRKDWAWAGASTAFKVVAPFEYALSGASEPLGLDLKAGIRKVSERQLTWELDLAARRATPEAIGGGISFRFDLANLGLRLGEPELLPDNRGWAWGRAGGPRLEMRFDPPLAAVFFERGQKAEVRAFFYKGEVPQGPRRHVATLTIAGDMKIAPTTAERFGLDDPATWPAAILDWPIAPWNISPVDLSFLNAQDRPAGRRGFLRADRDRLVFEDGTPARFWGTNLTAAALFGTDYENVRQQARRLSELGFNLVRLHHHDSFWVSPNIFGDARVSDTKSLSPSMLEKLDWWIKCLKDEGIYVWLDLHVQRRFKPGDGIEHFDEIAKGKPGADLKGYNYVNASIQAAMRRFAADYVGHLNPFTGLKYQDDPAVIALLLTNENDLTFHFGNALLPNSKVPQHNAVYMAEAAAFAARHGLAKDKTWRSWEHGPSKLFLNDLERRFSADQIGHLRGLGARGLIATTATWGGNPLSSLPALTAGDIIAVHSYGGIGELEKNPVHAANLMHWIAAAQVAGRPLAVPEWNVSPFPAPDRHAVPLYLGAAASLQGWDALMQYAYSQQGLSNRGSPGNWHAFNDPALMATLPAAALLYRRGDVAQARTTYVFAPGRDQLYGRLVSPANAAGLRTAAEKGRLVIALPATPELPWLDKSRIPEDATVIGDPGAALIAPDAGAVASDTGELRRDWETGTFTIDTARTQAALGWIGGLQMRLADVEIAVATRNATVAVQSLDGRPIREARAILVSLGARSVPGAGGRLPFHSEPVTGRLAVRAVPGLRLYRQHGLPAEARELPARYEGGRYRIELDRGLASYWLVLR